MKQLIYLFALFTFSIPKILGQNQDTNLAELEAKIPQEKVFIHYNSSILFPGEYLYYKLYTLNKENKNLSDISKIAYVELIDSSGKSVIKHKLNLDGGLGQGDFFIPTSLKSGNYKIVGYTKWMRNGGSKNYFSGNITIINPYRNDQEAILSTVDSTLTTKKVSEYLQVVDNMDDFKIELAEGTTYGKRDMVSFSIQNSRISKITGNFSISVRKKDSLDLPKRVTATNFLDSYLVSNRNTNRDSTFLPDLRGDLYSGKIIVKSNSQEIAQQEKIAISIPGDDFALQLSQADSKGNFYFILNEGDYGDDMFLQVTGENRKEYDIEVNQESYFDFANMKFEGFVINEDLRNLIVKRSIYNQIENSYYSAKPDTLRIKQHSVPFYGLKNVETYKLDDYTRFKTVQETFIEIITNARIRKGENGEAVFEVYPLLNAQNLISPALLLVDGVYIQDTERLLNYDALKIDEVELVRDKYFYGSKIFTGIIAIQTKDNDFLEGFTGDFITKESMIIPQLEKFYFKPDYSQNKPNSNRIPDFRLQLLWEPNFDYSEVTNGEVLFYTSDVPGEYEISIEGFTANGAPVSLIKSFKVK
ncbi:hypothetical protein [Gillisia sp. JM1]|uniref:hypothetical protein n=1 Tax=Gillisia sp. JM1 TaxID=1283286 RepID=UPI000416E36E|nr:hypothetical protein [Gillisia sp. JM1]